MQTPGIIIKDDVCVCVCTRMCVHVHVFCLSSEIQAYFENSYDLNESLFTALKGWCQRPSAFDEHGV